VTYRCDACGNRTRFDVFESKRVRAFHHYSLGGELNIEEEEVLEGKVEKVVCRWCGSADQVKEDTAAPAVEDGP
jgi:transposase